MKNFRIPQHIQMDSISPATRLLEMRKDMYEEQEVFEKKQEAFKASEDSFKRRENELREKDLKIQESLIKFSKFLEENEMKKNKANEREEVEKKEIAIKKKKIEELDQKYEELKDKYNRVERKVEAMKEYEDFLQMVKNAHPDEYNELNDIVNRYNTLHESNQKLQKNLDELIKKKEIVSGKMANYIKEKKTQQMTITNEIGGLQKQLEVLENTKSKLQSTSEESKLKRRQEMSEIGNIVMSIDNLYNKVVSKGEKKVDTSDTKYKTFEDLIVRGEFAIEQLENIKTNIEDKQRLIARLEARNQESRFK
jgi:chromosome segregation ATPase